MGFERWESAGYLVNHLARGLALALAREIEPLGVVPGQFPVLLCLWEQDGLTQKELVSRVRIEQATMSATLKRMERDGLIRREPDPGDGRVARVLLSDRARALHGPLTGAAEAVNRCALAGLSQGERRLLLEALRRMIGNLERAEE